MAKPAPRPADCLARGLPGPCRACGAYSDLGCGYDHAAAVRGSRPEACGRGGTVPRRPGLADLDHDGEG